MIRSTLVFIQLTTHIIFNYGIKSTLKSTIILICKNEYEKMFLMRVNKYVPGELVKLEQHYE